MCSLEEVAARPLSGTVHVAIVGPTASGKTGLALRLATLLDGDVVGCDALQVRAGLPILTAKPTPEELARRPHHLIGVLPLDRAASAAEYARLADVVLAKLGAAGRPAILCGGTGLYLRALCDGLFDGPAASPILRARLKEEAREHGIAALHRRLAEVDAPSAARIGPADYVRIERALEVYELTGRPLSAFFAEHERERQRGPRHHTLRIGLDPGPMDLRARIAARVEHMLQAGLLQEVAAVRALGPISDPPIGYDLCCRHLDGELTRAEFCEQLEQKTWQYARRQLTWFRKEPGVTFYPDADAVPVDEIVECIKRGGTAPAARSRKAG